MQEGSGPCKCLLKVVCSRLDEDSAWEGAPSPITNFVALFENGLLSFVNFTRQLGLMDLEIEPLETL
jgi:hypothetical protein